MCRVQEKVNIYAFKACLLADLDKFITWYTEEAMPASDEEFFPLTDEQSVDEWLDAYLIWKEDQSVVGSTEKTIKNSD